jgi:hypothetical protein
LHRRLQNGIITPGSSGWKHRSQIEHFMENRQVLVAGAVSLAEDFFEDPAESLLLGVSFFFALLSPLL